MSTITFCNDCFVVSLSSSTANITFLGDGIWFEELSELTLKHNASGQLELLEGPFDDSYLELYSLEKSFAEALRQLADSFDSGESQGDNKFIWVS